MMRKITTLLLSAVCALATFADIPQGYYTNALGKNDEALMTALEGIIYTHSQLSYNYLWRAYNATDMGSDGYYIDMYSTCKYNYNSTHVGNATYVGQGLNREHSFPKSWFGGEVYPMYTDLTMLIPTDAYVNQRRSNLPYGVCVGGYTYVTDSLGVSMLGRLGTSTYSGYSERVFEPDDEYKGDFARIYFYMVTCYKDSVSGWPGCDQLDKRNGYKAFSNWSMQMLMEWHRADPVSPKEISRNEAVYNEQGNRNPFVDHPELAEHIWGTRQHQEWTGEELPDDPTHVTPVMLKTDTTAVTGTSFRADWTNGGDVSSYTLQVNMLQDPIDEPELLMSEDFSKIQVTTEGSRDISSMLDSYTDNPGWTGYAVYPAVGSGVKLGTSTKVGYLNTPTLELGSTVTVIVNAASWLNSHGVSDESSLVVSCGDVSQSVRLGAEPTDYIIVLNHCQDATVKLSTTNGNKRLYIYHVDVYDGDLTAMALRRAVEEQGNSTWRNVSGISDTCYTVRELAGGTFEYLVKAIYTDGTESPWSNVRYVTLSGISDDEPMMGDINGDGLINISDVTTIINYILNGEVQDIVDENADLTGDGLINISDALRLINIVANLQTLQ